MATVHYGRLLGAAGFSRVVAIKRLHPQFAKNQDFVDMLVDEAHITSRIRHANLVATLDVVADAGELLMVMEYVRGEALSRLMRASRQRGERPPPPIVAAIVAGLLHGLHAAHEARDETGQALGVIHRDVSPQNVLVGADGIARVLDFGVAKCVGRLHVTREGHLKGKPAYMPPEQLRGDELSRRADIYAVGVVLWEALTAQRLFPGDDDYAIAARVLRGDIDRPGLHAHGLSEELDRLVLRAVASDAEARFATAEEMALALEAATPLANASDVAAWVRRLVPGVLEERDRAVEAVEREREPAPTESAELGASTPPPAPDATIPAGNSQVAVIPTGARTPMLTSPPRSSSRAWLLALALLAATVGVLAVVVRFGGASARESNATPLPPPPSTTTPVVAPAETAPPILVTSTPSATTTATAEARPSKAVRPARPLPPEPKAPSCNPPYTVDAAGIHHIKRECL